MHFLDVSKSKKSISIKTVYSIKLNKKEINRAKMIVVKNILHYNSNISDSTANLIILKLLLNIVLSVLSVLSTKFMTINIESY